MKKKSMPLTYVYSMRKCEKSKKLFKRITIIRVITTAFIIMFICFIIMFILNIF
mgnify:CR=1 FL=1